MINKLFDVANNETKIINTIFEVLLGSAIVSVV